MEIVASEVRVPVCGSGSAVVSVPLKLLRRLDWFRDADSAMVYCALLHGVLLCLLSPLSALQDGDGGVAVRIRSNKGSYFFTLPSKLIQLVDSKGKSMVWRLCRRSNELLKQPSLILWGQLTKEDDEAESSTAQVDAYTEAQKVTEDQWREARKWVYAFRKASGLPLPECDENGNLT